jgi:hypothetical protein
MLIGLFPHLAPLECEMLKLAFDLGIAPATCMSEI